MNKERKKSDKISFGKQTESMYIQQLFEISVPNLHIKFYLQPAPKKISYSS